MSELRRMLTVLRADDDSADDVGRQPRLADIDETLARVRRAGVEVTLDVRGTPARLDPSVDLAAFRVVQEALTNVVKHADAARCRITVRGRTEVVRVEVVDDGPTRPVPRRPGGGHGLIGMRERVGAHGGSLTAGPRDGGGFRVVADIPVTDPGAAR
jgi:signal transduction histidine kinase